MKWDKNSHIFQAFRGAYFTCWKSRVGVGDSHMKKICTHNICKIYEMFFKMCGKEDKSRNHISMRGDARELINN